MLALRRGGIDLLGVTGAAMVAGVAIGYVLLMRDQGDTPAAWVLFVLAGSVIAVTYGCWRAASYRRPVLLSAAVALFVLGILSLFSIGLPLLVASVLVAGSSDPSRTARGRVD